MCAIAIVCPLVVLSEIVVTHFPPCFKKEKKISCSFEYPLLKKKQRQVNQGRHGILLYFTHKSLRDIDVVRSVMVGNNSLHKI